jgi:hypothetical protein
VSFLAVELAPDVRAEGGREILASRFGNPLERGGAVVRPGEEGDVVGVRMSRRGLAEKIVDFRDRV